MLEEARLWGLCPPTLPTLKLRICYLGLQAFFCQVNRFLLYSIQMVCMENHPFYSYPLERNWQPFFARENLSGQIMIFHQPRFPWLFRGISLRSWGRYNLMLVSHDSFPSSTFSDHQSNPWNRISKPFRGISITVKLLQKVTTAINIINAIRAILSNELMQKEKAETVVASTLYRLPWGFRFGITTWASLAGGRWHFIPPDRRGCSSKSLANGS